jgi:UDPglucose 6-dehydrogenase
METSKKIGFIGQGWIGKNYADDFEERGFSVVRYAKEPQYEGNKDAIAECDIVLIAVPTPTTPEGFDDSIIRAVLPLVGKRKIAVLKSTIVPGTTAKLQEMFPDITLLYSPEFLSEATAKYDTSNPFASVVGVSKETDMHRSAAEEVLSVLPKAPFSLVCKSTEAEIFKYTHNTSGFIQIIFFNMMYDFATKMGCDWSVIRSAIMSDPFIPNRYSEPVHKSGRGAGGHCFIKDFEAFTRVYTEMLPDDESGSTILRANIQKNIHLLTSTKKDLDLLEGVYGPDVMK